MAEQNLKSRCQLAFVEDQVSIFRAQELYSKGNTQREGTFGFPLASITKPRFLDCNLRPSRAHSLLPASDQDDVDQMKWQEHHHYGGRQHWTPHLQTRLAAIRSESSRRLPTTMSLKSKHWRNGPFMLVWILPRPEAPIEPTSPYLVTSSIIASHNIDVKPLICLCIATLQP